MLLWKKILKDDSRCREAFWIVFSQSMNTKSTALWVWEYFVFHLKGLEITRALMKDSCLGGPTCPALFHLLSLWGQCWGKRWYHPPLRGRHLSEGQLAHLCFQLDFSAPPVGSLAGHWVLAPGHLSSSYPPLSLCPSCAVRLALVEAEDQQTLGIYLSLFYVHSLWHVGS